jgi:DNA repair photolyase
VVRAFSKRITQCKEQDRILNELKRLRSLKNIFESLMNCNNANGRKMFNIITKTWNPVTGCYHSCIYCWARKLALRKLRNAERYRNGFIPKLNQGEFNDRFDGGIVFVSDMGDLLGDFIPRKWIESVINYVKKFPNTYFLLLTKNPARYHEFLDKMPSNIILGVTIETNRDDLYLKKMISKAPLPSKRYEAMQKLNWDKKFISIEPILDFDLEKFAQWIEEIEPLMIYIGYDNYNNKLPEPSINKTLKLIEVLSETTLIIKKTIRSAWNERLETFIA